MLDFVILLVIHGYTTARFNEQVKNNIEKFDSDFMFQLNKSELEYLQSNFFDRKY
ncbi:ORF6N domain-containing protein [Gardnerella piotii]|uniref:ORF6N domain-containing protein n=1 Tax=Gardnerella piotii TaxID=2792977 RepID=UPI0030B83F10